MHEHRRWPEYQSYAYLTIFDGPDNNEDEFAPTEPPGAGDPTLYTLDPMELSRSSGVAASRTGRRGDRRRNGRYETRNFWEVRSGLPDDCAPDEHVHNVLNQLSPGWSTFLNLTQRYFAVMRVVIKGPNPGIGIDRKDMMRLADLGASLDIDAYGVVERDGDGQS